MKRQYKTIMLGCVVLMTVACGNETVADRIASQMVGRWASERCEARPDGQGGHLYLTRDFRVHEDSWDGDFAFFADKDCKSQNMQVFASGPYTVLGDSAIAETAEATFSMTHVEITPKNDQTAGFLNSAPPGTCGGATWAANAEQDVTSTDGCSLIGVDLKKCGTEYEIVKVTGNKLLFGARPADGGGLCTASRRPTTFQVPLLRVIQN